jgi:hypothetical protein
MGPPQNSPNDHLTNTKIWSPAYYGSASPTTLKTLDLVQHKGVRLALGTFAVCRTENVLKEAGYAHLRK